MTDPVHLTADLIRCRSVTPANDGALEVIEAILTDAGFECARVDRNGTPNLFARWGAKGAKTLGFNGHTDVVPVGDETAWTVDPFGATEKDGKLWGRGAVDMKSGVAAYVAAAVEYAKENTPEDRALIVTITGDEEGPATDGTLALLEYMDQTGERMDACVVGEPTCPTTFGEMMKIGRRGSINIHLTATGTQGHVAYPHLAANPMPVLTTLLAELSQHTLDQGSRHFDPSSLQVTSIDTGNKASNVIPETCHAALNIRFNDMHTGAELATWVGAKAREASMGTDISIDVTHKISGESFFTAPGPFVDLIADAVEAETQIRPTYSTSGGTSDARFVKDHCPVVEFGLVGQTMHKVDEHVEIAQITALKKVYARIIKGYFS